MVDDLPDILVLNDTVEDDKILFKNVDYFIATTNIDTIKYIEMAKGFNAEVLPEVDIRVRSTQLL